MIRVWPILVSAVVSAVLVWTGSWPRRPPDAVDPVLDAYAVLEMGQLGVAQRRFLALRRLLDSDLPSRHSRLGISRALSIVLLADAEVRAGRLEAAVERLSPRVEEPHPLLHDARGVALALLGRRDEARTALDEALALRPEWPEALVNRGIVRHLQGDEPGALQDLDRAVSLAPDFAFAFNARGVVQFDANLIAAAADFRAAVEIAPEFEEARENLDLAREHAARAMTTGSLYRMQVVGTGINAEADLDYWRRHQALMPSDRPPTTIYVAFRGTLPLAGVRRARMAGYDTLVIDPAKLDAGLRELQTVVRRAVEAGRDPRVFVDINKWVPFQLGNTAQKTVGAPARVIAEIQRAFGEAVVRRGGVGESWLVGHSDFTYPALEASGLATTLGHPFNRVVVESPRSEEWYRQAIAASPRTSFTAVVAQDGDYYTKEAQGRALFDRTAYRESISRFTGFSMPNSTVFVVTDASHPKTPFQHLNRAAHGEMADLTRSSTIQVWRGGSLRTTVTSTLNDLHRQGTLPWIPTNTTQTRGGVQIVSPRIERGASGRLTFNFGASARQGGPLLKFMLFGGPLAAESFPGSEAHAGTGNR